MRYLILIIISYLLGASPNAYIIARLVRDIDIRNYGSGNVGATNVARILGFKYGIIVLLLDILKGFLAVYIAGIFFPQASLPLVLAGVMVIVGHSFSVFIEFTGGKGVATMVGVILGLYPFAILIFILVWLSVTAGTRYVSLGSILGAFSLPLVFWVKGYNHYIIFGIFIVLFLIYTHRENIKRLLAGKENKLGKSSGKSGK